MGTGEYASVEQACGAAIKVTETLRPHRRTTRIYDALGAAYRSLYPSLREEFHGLGALS